MIERSGGGQPGFAGAPQVSIGLRELLDAAPDVIFCCDAKGHFVWLSHATEALVGAKSADLLGRSYSKLVPVPQRGHLARRVLKRARHLQSEPAVDVVKVVTQDGRELWMSIRSRMSLRPDGELVFVGTARPMSKAELNAWAQHGDTLAASAVAVVKQQSTDTAKQRASLGIMSGPTAIDPEHSTFAGPYGAKKPAAPSSEKIMPPAEEFRGGPNEPVFNAPASGAEIAAAVQAANTARAAAERQVAELEEQLDRAHDRTKQLESERDQVQGERDGLRNEMTAASQRRVELERDLTAAREAHESEKRVHESEQRQY